MCFQEKYAKPFHNKVSSSKLNPTLLFYITIPVINRSIAEININVVLSSICEINPIPVIPIVTRHNPISEIFHFKLLLLVSLNLQS